MAQFLIEIKKYDKIEIIGLMTIGKDEDDQKTEEAFSKCEALSKIHHLPFLSMGMSNDFECALKIPCNSFKNRSEVFRNY